MLPKQKVWVARDKNNKLYMFNKLPIRSEEIWEPPMGPDIYVFQIPKEWFPELTWADKPKQMKFVLRKKTSDDKLEDKVIDVLTTGNLAIGEIDEST